MSDIDNIDLSNIKDEIEFKICFLSKYGCDDDKTNMKLKEICNHMAQTKQVYNFTKLYYDICSHIWQFNAPELPEIRYLLLKNKVVVNRDEGLNLEGKFDGVNGTWRCKYCNGEGGRNLDSYKSSIPYIYFVMCTACEGEGRSHNRIDNIWIAFDNTPFTEHVKNEYNKNKRSET